MNKADKKYFADLLKDHHDMFFVDIEQRFNHLTQPMQQLLSEHETILNGTNKNPGGLTKKVESHERFILRAKFMGALISPATVALWEGIKMFFHFNTNK